MAKSRVHRIIVITGLSGSGKSVALAALEDAEFYCVDNMPVVLLPKFLELAHETETEFSGLAFVMDLRERGFVSAFPGISHDLRNKGYKIEILFLEADIAIILRRYSQTRRHHPLSGDLSLTEGIRLEMEQLAPVRELADHVVDTSAYNIHELKSVVFDLVEASTQRSGMHINIVSFGFKHGIPPEADIIMDVRFIKNPFFVPDLKPMDGRDTAVRRFVLNDGNTNLFLERFYGLIDFLVPLYEKENRAYLTISFGCTGGKHRSVAIAEEVRDHVNATGRKAKLVHRDVDIEL
ncbi:MAG: RNase adapter RapZ [Deltaproteobacteria bacterium]|nr:RNase adapter RapZ [Deltaproteobacteria bacterium]